MRAVYASGGLVSVGSVLDSPFCYLPYDIIVPGLLKLADLSDLAAALVPCPLRLDGLVDGLNRPVEALALASSFRTTTDAYQKAGALVRLRMSVRRSQGADVARWLLEQLFADE